MPKSGQQGGTVRSRSAQRRENRGGVTPYSFQPCMMGPCNRKRLSNTTCPGENNRFRSVSILRFSLIPFTSNITPSNRATIPRITISSARTPIGLKMIRPTRKRERMAIPIRLTNPSGIPARPLRARPNSITALASIHTARIPKRAVIQKFSGRYKCDDSCKCDGHTPIKDIFFEDPDRCCADRLS